MKKNLLLLAALAITSVSSFGQSTLFFDNFDPATFPASVTSNTGFTASTPSSSVSDAVATYTGYNSSVNGFFLTSSNGTSGLNCIWNATSSTFTTNLSVQASSAADSKGTSTIAVPFTSFNTAFKPILKNNSDVITWSYAMRINRSSQLTPFATAFNSGASICGGVILATDAAANQPIADVNSSASGYAVILSGSDAGSNNVLTLGYFKNGLSYDSAGATSTFTSLLKVENITVGGNGLSVIVTYTPSTNIWTLKVRQDGSTSLIDPEVDTTNAFTVSTPASAFNNELTSATMTNMMLYYNHNATNGIYVDNLKVKTNANLGTAKNEVSGLNVYPNPVSNGVVYINSNSSDAKNVTVYDVLGKQLIQAKVSNGTLDVSSLRKGVYLMKVTEGAASSTKKLIID